MKKYNITDVLIENDMLILKINENKKEFKLNNISSKLFNASFEERNNFEISESGYGIHWISIDEHLSIDGLLGIVHLPEKDIKIA